MRSAILRAVPTLAVGIVGFVACGGASRSDGAQQAGANSSGASAGTSGRGGTGLGGKGGATDRAGSSAGGSNSRACEADDCGPQLGLPNWTCEDGTMGGPTGRCIEDAGGDCVWEVKSCPPSQGGASGASGAGAGGTGGSSQGGQAGVAGTSSSGGIGNEGGAASDECGGCDGESQICIYQVGGPGVGRFTCATQNPCGAAGACACIVGQGTCQSALMGNPPHYCVCDNGLE
jgi:hypothetical protein